MSSPISTSPLATSPSIAHFRAVFGCEPTINVRAPGRINLIGEHVDYQDGLVMPAAIDRYVFGSARPIPDAEVRLCSSLGHSLLHIPLDRDRPMGGDNHWANYVFGVIAKYRDAGHRVAGFEAAFDADLPLGAGLSSSAALESATAMIVESVLGIDLPPVERALLCQAAEHDWAGVPCGIMDQLAVNAGVAGHALEIDCRTLEVSPTPLPDGLAVVVIDSKVKHALADGEYAKRKADCETAACALGVKTLRDVDIAALGAARGSLGELVFKRARHVITEIARVGEFAGALEAGDIGAAGKLMAASHDSLRDDFEVSCSELDAIVDIARGEGVLGARMMGGGFGGSTVNLIAEKDAASFAKNVVTRYRDQHHAEIEAFVVHPVAGARKETSA